MLIAKKEKKSTEPLNPDNLDAMFLILY